MNPTIDQVKVVTRRTPNGEYVHSIEIGDNGMSISFPQGYIPHIEGLNIRLLEIASERTEIESRIRRSGDNRFKESMLFY